MPFGEWKDFNHCVKSVMAEKEWEKERASAYCASIARKAGEELQAQDYDMKVKFFSDDSNNYSLLIDKKLLVDCHTGLRERLPDSVKSLILTHFSEKMMNSFKEIKNYRKGYLKVYGLKNTLKMYRKKIKNLRYIKLYAIKPNKTYKISGKIVTAFPVKFSLFRIYNPASALKIDNMFYMPVVEPNWFKNNSSIKKELSKTSLNILSNQLNVKEYLGELEKYNVKNIYFTNGTKQELKSHRSCYDGLLLGIKKLKEGEIHKNMDLDEIDNKYLLYIHGKLHSFYPDGTDINTNQYTPKTIWEFHNRVSDEMKNRGLKHMGKDILDSEEFEEPKEQVNMKLRDYENLYDPVTRQLLDDLEISLTGETRQLVTLSSAIGVDLSQDVKLPYKFKFIALREGKYNGVFYDKSKLEYATPSLLGKDITLDHGSSVRDIVGVVEDVWWNPELEQIEGIGVIKTDIDIATKIHEKLITGVSVEIFVKYVKTKKGLSADNPRFTAISLVKNPACKTCGITETDITS